MSQDVTANSRTIAYKGDGIVNVSALPDACKTPTPAGPTPIPYLNIARDADLVKGSKRVRIHGDPIALRKSRLSKSTGDEPGTLGGIISGKTLGKMTWGSSSPDVCVEGQGVVRFFEPTHHNCNTFNVVKVQGGSPFVIVKYGDDSPCPICGQRHRALPDRTESDTTVLDKASALIDKLTSAGLRDDFMIAVTKCADCGKHVAARSATYTDTMDFKNKQIYPHGDPRTAFQDAALSLGCETEAAWGRVGKASGTSKTIMESAIHNSVRKMYKSRVKRASKFEEAIAKIRPDIHQNDIGQCAGPRALALAFALKHNPEMLCERWYYGFKRKRVKSYVEVREWQDVQSYLGGANYTVRRPAGSVTKFRHSFRVPSCRTCEVLIPALLCRERKKCRAK
jgi:hypothetical protein